MALPILYSFRRCPYAIRARMALHKAGIAWEHREVSLKNKPAQMLAVSGKGTVPVLCQTDGTTLDESFDIMTWALQQHDPDNWLQVDMAEFMPLLEQNDNGFKASLDRYKYHTRYPQFSQIDYRQQGEQFLNILERLLLQHGKGLFADRLTLADVAIFPFVRQFAGVDRDWFDSSDYQQLLQWLQLMETSEDFLVIMQKHVLWN